jgi:hypothetical protein
MRRKIPAINEATTSPITTKTATDGRGWLLLSPEAVLLVLAAPATSSVTVTEVVGRVESPTALGGRNDGEPDGLAAEICTMVVTVLVVGVEWMAVTNVRVDVVHASEGRPASVELDVWLLVVDVVETVLLVVVVFVPAGKEESAIDGVVVELVVAMILVP